jgi:hypothetical protein
MRKQTLPVSASTPTLTPLAPQHTHEVICKCSGCTLVIRCFSLAAAEREARWKQRSGADIEIVEAGE